MLVKGKGNLKVQIMDLENKIEQAKRLIDHFYSIHSEQINHHDSNINFDLIYFIHFYHIILMKKIKNIFNLSDEQFEKLQVNPAFQNSIIKYIDAVVIKLANKALDQRLYSPRRKTSRKP